MSLRKATWINLRSDWSTDPEEVANSITHGLGFLLSLVGAAALMMRVFRDGDGWRIVGCMIYASSLVSVYAMSTLSHCCTEPNLKRRFGILDQAFIYLLITGTYTPFALAFLRVSPWLQFLALMWTIAIIGFISKVILPHSMVRVWVWTYVVLGWMPIFSAPYLVGIVPDAALWWMLIGGLCYTFGTLFLVLDHRVRHFHALWHVMVIAGSTCHFASIYLYVAPLKQSL